MTSCHIETRVLVDADVDAFWRLRLRALREEPNSFTASYEESLDRPQEEAIKKMLASNDAFVIGAFTPNLVGMLGFHRRAPLKARHNGIFWGVYVVPESRGLGVSRALMSAAVARARTLPNLYQIFLSVGSTNEVARQLYRSLGFAEYGIEPAALKVEDKYLDEVLMVLALSADSAS